MVNDVVLDHCESHQWRKNYAASPAASRFRAQPSRREGSGLVGSICSSYQLCGGRYLTACFSSAAFDNWRVGDFCELRVLVAFRFDFVAALGITGTIERFDAQVKS